MTIQTTIMFGTFMLMMVALVIAPTIGVLFTCVLVGEIISASMSKKSGQGKSSFYSTNGGMDYYFGATSVGRPTAAAYMNNNLQSIDRRLQAIERQH